MTDKQDDFYGEMRHVIEGYKALCAYVAAIPVEVQLPAMPGIDRDFYDAQAELAEAELAKLREQKPVAWMHDKDGRVDTCHDSVKELWIKVGQKQNTQFMREIVPCRVEHYNIPLYAAPVAAPAVPDWNVNIERIRDVMHMLGISIDESVECFSAALPTNINRMTLAMKRHLQKLAGMTAITPTPFIPDDDTRRNDEAFAAQQAAPSVPDGCAIVSRTLTPEAWKRLCNADIWPVTPKSFQRMLDVLMEVAMLQSANHSEG